MNTLGTRGRREGGEGRREGGKEEQRVVMKG
jgi:hypothetical protein